MNYKSVILIFCIFFLWNCNENNETRQVLNGDVKELTIFYVNDQHGQLDNFAKIKHIVDEEKKESNVILACSGDAFSGNPVVDNHPQKGYPMIDVMNSTGFDVAVLGNHEFDYGEEILEERIRQSEFQWICANIDVSKTELPEIASYTTLSIEDIGITFLGLVETNGKRNSTIPLTHPWKVKNLTFQRPETVVSNFSTLKEQEGSDLLIALTHLGHSGNEGSLGDFQLASQFPYFDLIIGGHSHYRIDTVVNNVPIFQAGSYLEFMGKIELEVMDGTIQSYQYQLIDLNDYVALDVALMAKIDEYNDLPELKEIIGFSQQYHNRSQVGCFFTDALLETMNVDVTFQNTGGIRSDLDEGDITKREIFEVDPFNNGTIKYSLTIKEIKNFLKGTGSGFYYAGIHIEQDGETLTIKNKEGKVLGDNTELSLGINDYIPAVHDQYFPAEGESQVMTSAESLIFYLENINDQVNYPNCNKYFRYE